MDYKVHGKTFGIYESSPETYFALVDFLRRRRPNTQLTVEVLSGGGSLDAVTAILAELGERGNVHVRGKSLWSAGCVYALHSSFHDPVVNAWTHGIGPGDLFTEVQSLEHIRNFYGSELQKLKTLPCINPVRLQKMGEYYSKHIYKQLLDSMLSENRHPTDIWIDVTQFINDLIIKH